MYNRKQIKKDAKQTIKHHYFLLVILCLISGVLGSEFTNVLIFGQRTMIQKYRKKLKIFNHHKSLVEVHHYLPSLIMLFLEISMKRKESPQKQKRVTKMKLMIPRIVLVTQKASYQNSLFLLCQEVL